MSQWSANLSNKQQPTPSPSPPSDSPPLPADEFKSSQPQQKKQQPQPTSTFAHHQRSYSRPVTPPSDGDYGIPVNDSPRNSIRRHKRNSSRPLSMVQTWQPSIMELNEDTTPELLPVFSYLNSHSNKLYQEGYFLKLDDQNSRTWTLCPSQRLQFHYYPSNP